MANWAFTHGVHEIGNGLYGYVQPDGTWGFSNAGLVADGGETLLIDTLMTIGLTRDMLAEFARIGPATEKIDRLFNTHANPDHFMGNAAVEGADIIATEICAKDMREFNPAMFEALPANWQNMGDAGEFLYETMGRKFDFAGACVVAPTTTFEKRLTLQVGAKTVELIDLGPAHTGSDTIAHVPADRVVFTGDLLFNEGSPIMWAGPIENWIAACEHIEGLDVDVVVPGHGPITDKQAVRNLRSYFEYVRDQARARFDAGMGWEEAARDINLREFRNWSDPERIVANVFSLYRQWGTVFSQEENRSLFGAMGRYHKQRMAHAGECDHAH